MRYPHSPRATVIIFILLLAALVVLAGCENMGPVLGYEHLSQPNVDDDARDMGCAGGRAWQDELELQASLCVDAWTNDKLVRISAQWRP